MIINNKEINNNIKEKIRPLIPLDDVDIDVYKDVLDYAIENPDINNIAITAPYGGGKSSVIRSYEKQYNNKYNNKYKFIYVPIWELECEIDNFSLEKKIIRHLNIKNNQEKDKIRIKKIKSIVQGSIIIKLSPIITLISILYLVLLKLNIIYIDLSKYYKILNVVAFILLIFTGIWVIGNIDLGKTIKKINVEYINLGGLKLNVPKKDGQTLIDENQEKILEILDSIVYDNAIIVFEDIDRYNDVKVFSDLRELNYLANIQKGIKIKFIYLVREDIFKPKEKSKFFDLIIPIIPSVDSSNSFDYLESKLKEYIKYDNHLTNRDKEGELIDIKYLFEISIYLDEIRLINHILNEFYIYANQLKIDYINYTQLFSILVYKNLCPKNFQLYHKEKNYISYIFKKLDKKRKEKIESELGFLDKLKFYKNDAKSEIESIDQDIIKLEREINFYRYADDNKIISLLDENDYLMDDGIFEKSLVEEIEQNKDILIFLLKNGYITRTSENYLVNSSYKYLYSKDIAFYKNVIEGKGTNYNYRLINPKAILNLLDNKHLERKAILNFDIMEVLVKTKDKERISIVFDMIKKTSSIDFIGEYINLIIQSDRIRIANIEFFLSQLHENWYDFFKKDDIYISKNKYDLNKHLSLLFFVYSWESKELNKILRTHKLKKYIEENIYIFYEVFHNYNSLSKKTNKKNESRKLFIGALLKVLNNNNYKFELNKSFTRGPITFTDVYFWDMYRYDRESIMYIYNLTDIPINNISQLRSNKNYLYFWEYTQKYNHIRILLNALLENDIDIIIEEEKDYIYILKENISYITKEKLINKIDLILSSVKDIYNINLEDFDISNTKHRDNHMLVMALLERNKIKPTILNLIYIYNGIENFKHNKVMYENMLKVLVNHFNNHGRLIIDLDKNQINKRYMEILRKLKYELEHDLSKSMISQLESIIL